MDKREFEISTKEIKNYSKKIKKDNAPELKEIIEQIKKQKEESGD